MYNYLPNQEKSAAEIVVEILRCKVEAHPEQIPAQLLLAVLAGRPDPVPKQLSELMALNKTIHFQKLQISCQVNRI